MNDTCNQAKLLAKMIAQRIKDDVQTKFGEEWNHMSQEARDQETLVVLLGCWHHLRNLVIDWGKKDENKMMEEL